jgi:hypothetical protein
MRRSGVRVAAGSTRIVCRLLPYRVQRWAQRTCALTIRVASQDRGLACGTSPPPRHTERVRRATRTLGRLAPHAVHCPSPSQHCLARARRDSGVGVAADRVARAGVRPRRQECLGRDLHATGHEGRGRRIRARRRGYFRRSASRALPVLRAGCNDVGHATGARGRCCASVGGHRTACAFPACPADPVRLGRSTAARAAFPLLTD